MKLNRNESAGGIGKYIVIKTEGLEEIPTTPVELAAAILKHPECVQFGKVGDPDEFFVLKLKDENADAALFAYSDKVMRTDIEYGEDIYNLAERSGLNHPHCKTPD